MNFSLRGAFARIKDSAWTITQIVLAATTAYLIARFGLGHPVPLLAVTVSISSLGFSRDTRPDRVLTTALAMVFGILISEILLLSFGSGPVQLFVAIASSLVLARLISANPAFALTVSLQAVLVQLLQEPTGGVFARAIDGVIGGLVALIFTAMLPRNPIKLARNDAAKLFEIFGETLSVMRMVLAKPDVVIADQALEKIRATQPLVDNWRGSLESAAAISRISPFYRWAQKEVRDQGLVLEGMDLATRNLRVVTRRVDYLVRDLKPRPQLAELIEKIITAVKLIESSGDDFSVSQKARKYLPKLIKELDPKRFEPALTLSEAAVLMQFRPLVIDLCHASGLDGVKARDLLPRVD